jgi:Lipase
MKLVTFLLVTQLVSQSVLTDTADTKKEFKKVILTDANKSFGCIIITKQDDPQYSWLRFFQRSWNEIKCENCDGKFKKRPTRVLIHGWSIFGRSNFGLIEDVYKKLYDEKFNIVKVMWGAMPFVYKDAVDYIRNTVSNEVAKYLDNNLGKNETLWKQLKIVGHSLGLQRT